MIKVTDEKWNCGESRGIGKKRGKEVRLFKGKAVTTCVVFGGQTEGLVN